MSDFATLRRTMVDTQLRTNKVTDERVLAAMGDIAREEFVPADRAALAYIDEDIAVGPDRYLIEPMIFARMIHSATIGPEDVVLDIACGTGYSSAVLGRLARAVVALESDSALAQSAATNLSEGGFDNVVVEEGPAEQGWPAQGPYDVILINGAVGRIPEALVEQLAEGGRLCTVVRRPGGTGTAELHIKTRGIVSSRGLFDANIPVLSEFALEEGFQF